MAENTNNLQARKSCFDMSDKSRKSTWFRLWHLSSSDPFLSCAASCFLLVKKLPETTLHLTYLLNIHFMCLFKPPPLWSFTLWMCGGHEACRLGMRTCGIQCENFLNLHHCGALTLWMCGGHEACRLGMRTCGIIIIIIVYSGRNWLSTGLFCSNALIEAT